LRIPLEPQFKEIQKKIINEKNCNVRLKILIDKILGKGFIGDQYEIKKGLEQLIRYNHINHIVINKIAIYVILEELVNYDIFNEFKDEFDNLLKRCNMTYASLKDYAVDLEHFKDFDEFKNKYNLYYQFYLRGYGTKNKDKLKRLVETLFEIIKENFPFLLYKIHQISFKDLNIVNDENDEIKILDVFNTENLLSILENLIEIIKRIRNDENLFQSFFKLLSVIFKKYDNELTAELESKKNTLIGIIDDGVRLQLEAKGLNKKELDLELERLKKEELIFFLSNIKKNY